MTTTRKLIESALEGEPRKLNKRDRMYERITRHGNQLLKIFPNATVKDPVTLCKRLRTLEVQANHATTAYANGVMGEEAVDSALAPIVARLHKLLGLTPQQAKEAGVMINYDPRGYALKIDDEKIRANNLDIHRDWGGYGILAPDLTNY